MIASIYTKNKYLLLLAVFLFIGFNQRGLVAQVTVIKNINSNGIARSFRVHLPTDYDKTKSLPIVFNFHGFGSSSIEQEIYSGMNEVSDKNNFIVIYPEGISKAWNVGWLFGSTAFDVKFVGDMIDYMTKEYNINTKRVYACGMSNGGFMSYRLACELSDRITAIASVTGSIFAPELLKCKPNRTIPILEIHGTADNVVNYNGSFGLAQGIVEILNFWRDNNGCDLQPTIEKLPKINPAEITNTELIRYTNCKNDHEVLHYKVYNGGHTWPGSLISAGVTSQDFNASAEIWKFFDRFESTSTSYTDNLGQKEKYNLKFGNPVSDIIALNFNQPAEVNIFNLAGQFVINKHLTISDQNINVAHLEPGLYFMSIKINGISEVYKIIK